MGTGPVSEGVHCTLLPAADGSSAVRVTPVALLLLPRGRVQLSGPVWSDLAADTAALL